jgi:hypothetical protein
MGISVVRIPDPSTVVSWEGTTSPETMVDPNVGNPTIGSNGAAVLVSLLSPPEGCVRTTPYVLVDDGVFWEWL